MSRIKQPALYLTSVPKYQNSLSLKYSWFVLVASILTVSIQWRIQVLFGARLYSGIQKSSVTQIASFPRTSSPQRTQVIGRKPAPWSWCLMPVYIVSLPNTRWGIVVPESLAKALWVLILCLHCNERCTCDGLLGVWGGQWKTCPAFLGSAFLSSL